METAPVGVPESPAAVAEALGSLGFRPSRRRGQSFLTDPFVADAEAALVDRPRDSPVLEVGGGLGILTGALLRRGYTNVTVVEIDGRLARHLRTAFGERVQVVVGDALDVPLPEGAAVVGNLPYAAATPILIRLLKARVPRVVAMVQNEVAERLAATPGPGTYGRLSILTQLFAEVELFRRVGPASFQPRPAVESRILTLTARPDPLAVASVERLEEVVRVLFSSRRKQLGNLLPRLTDDPDGVAGRAGWPENWRHLRPEQLPPNAFHALANTLS
ncbi:MAG: 16S rRNA (adenine(1518)-N(6)/adenine(1519)-N(6))-dimethyltransferase RsmA [Thermoplasmata archaeon]|nr:16S rRNA (adenine(1518)-N(6)/adenine(1519)-N(6))-dimethyltransferase RsmA [Thermoplasmata archaeon]MCI4361985.1 16S rRNA (adenine(1518)-N(6)/adenine(1519)-N(6))-dimethyltransferase RsmA [Thermoplasmata archaeon]